MITSNHNNLFWPGREKYTGWVFPDSLVVGQRFLMETMEAGRLWTGPVLSVRTIQERLGGREIVRFRTANSEYELETEELNGD